MEFTSKSWHVRFQQQARWTQALRRYLYEKIGLDQSSRLLEVGCGTGAILAEFQTTFAGHSPRQIVGLDINGSHLQWAAHHSLSDLPSEAGLICGDANQLPFPTGVFDVCICHFLIMWLKNPRQVIGEMARITRPSGFVLILAEPDYGGRIDYPAELSPLGEWQRQALSSQGADPLAGRKLSGWMHQAGLGEIETGVLGGQWQAAPTPNEWVSEWSILQHDLSPQISPQELQALRSIDAAAWESGERVLYVPTFYAWGRV